MRPDASAEDFKEDPRICPYPHYARLREQDPVSQVRRANGTAPYLVTTYRDAKSLLTDQRLAKDPATWLRTLTEAGRAADYNELALGVPDNMLTRDPPDHTRLRRLLAAEFTVHRTAALRPRIAALADQLIDAFVRDGSADLMAAFAYPLPGLIIAELLGVPAEDRRLFQSLAQRSLLPSNDPGRSEAQTALAAYLAAAIAGKRAQPGPDLLSALVVSRAEDRLTDAELLGSAMLLLIAGHDTTVNLLGNGMLALLQHPDQLAALRENPDLIPDAVEELLRYDGPVERATPRFATQDIEVGATTIPAGGIVAIALGSADRDPEYFADPDVLDVTRRPRGHLAFGHGLHFCLGAPLARLEGEIAFGALVRRLPGVELAVPVESLTYRASTIMRGLESLPVRFVPEMSPNR